MKTIITVKYDVSELIPKNLNAEEVIEFFGDNAELLADADPTLNDFGNIVRRVEIRP